ncbi:MAG: transcription-repair coupling factor, partial [Carnobacterium inhibens]
MGDVVQLLAGMDNVKAVIDPIGKKQSQLITGLSGSARTLVIAAILEQKQKPIVVIAHNLFHANQLMEDFSGMVDEDQLHIFPVDEMVYAEMAIASPEARSERIAAMDFLLSGKPGIVLVPVAGVRKLLPSVELWKENSFEVEMGGELDPSELA